MKLPNLKLATVAETFLPEEQGKIDLHFTKIPEYFNGTDAMRTELCVYCLRDAEIPIKLAVCLNAVNSVVERGRVTRLPLDWVPSRGTVMRFTSLLLAKVSTAYHKVYQRVPYFVPSACSRPRRVAPRLPFCYP